MTTTRSTRSGSDRRRPRSLRFRKACGCSTGSVPPSRTSTRRAATRSSTHTLSSAGRADSLPHLRRSGSRTMTEARLCEWTRATTRRPRPFTSARAQARWPRRQRECGSPRPPGVNHIGAGRSGSSKQRMETGPRSTRRCSRSRPRSPCKGSPTMASSRWTKSPGPTAPASCRTSRSRCQTRPTAEPPTPFAFGPGSAIRTERFCGRSTSGTPSSGCSTSGRSAPTSSPTSSELGHA